jgi:hypothetical protein
MNNIGVLPPTCVTIDVDFKKACAIDAVGPKGICRNPTLGKCGGEAQHLEKLGIWSPPELPNV